MWVFGERLTKQMVENGVIDKKERDLYLFGIQTMAILGLNIVTALFIGWIFHMFVPAVVYLISFAILRSYAGGYHAGNYVSCYILSCISLCIIFFILQSPAKWLLPVTLFLLCTAILIIWIKAPLADANRPLNEEQTHTARMKTRRILVGEILVGGVLFLIQPVLGYAVCYGIISCGVSFLAYVMKHVKREVI